MIACLARPNVSNSFLALAFVNERKWLCHVVDPTLIKLDKYFHFALAGVSGYGYFLLLRIEATLDVVFL